jgi:ribose-phosphate pyrophosphokinase
MAIEKPASKQMVIASGRAHQSLAQEVAEILQTELVPVTAYDFANGETFVRYERSVRGVDAFIIQAHPNPINHWVMEQLLMVDAMKRASAKRITVVAPFFPLRPPGQEAQGTRANLREVVT